MDPVFRNRRIAVGFMLASFLGLGVALLFARNDDPSSVAVAGGTTATATSVTGDLAAVAAVPIDSVVADPGSDAVGDVAGLESLDAVSCQISTALAQGSTGEPVTCLQQALRAADFLSGGTDGEFDFATDQAVRALQADRKLFVDGIAGQETAKSLGIWPEEILHVIRTPEPPLETLDSTGYYLSTVASMGSDAPPLPTDSGSGRRVVYERVGQRVWAVDDDERIIRSWLVSGSKYSNETPGTYEVYSKSAQTTAWNGAATLDKMVRYLRTDIGHIGFHAIPRHVADGTVYQTEAELGTRLSGGCQRQAELDAAFLYAWADIGTTVVVI